MKRKLKVGRFELTILSDGHFMGDCGTFFGIVPKALWKLKVSPDEDNLMPIALNPLLIRTPDKNILVDTGVGDKFSEDDKHKRIWRIEKSNSVSASLASERLTAESIDFVILTHLHFDHAGGNTMLNGGKLKPVFRNATYLAQREEWAAARFPGLLGKSSYFPENLLPLEEAGQLKLLEGDSLILPGIRVVLTGGHTRGHQIVLIESDGEKAIVPGDIAPTSMHTKPTWNTAFDIDPTTTCVMKERYLGLAREQKSPVVFYHDTKIGFGRFGLKWDIEEIP
ncbi:MAG: MBL fold metallo-hydrolase [Candidatus Eisenbacteria bacterium]|nr:MBL fold metallo-hydrolase [Candidatus Eisenbacteria bacterium]